MESQQVTEASERRPVASIGAAPSTTLDARERVYVATAYANAETVETLIRPALEALGIRLISTWHEPPYHPENLAEMPTMRMLAAHWVNRAQIQKADAVLVLDSPGARETWCEVEYAVQKDIRVVYVGERPPPLTVAHAARADMAAVFTKFDDVLAALERTVDSETKEVRTDIAA